jgi:acyl-CoA synthetase (AMP-forming)/AMP-acid ligase II
MLVGDGPADLSVPSATVDDLREESATTRSPSPSDIALIQFSSGTTSRPKGTVLSHETMMTRIGLRASGATGDQHHVLKWNPMHTGAMITSVVHHALARGDHVTVSPPRLFTSDMGRWLREISARGITQGGGPTFAYDLASRAIERGDVRDIDLTGWRSASAAGEVMDPSVLVRFAALAAPFGFEEDRFLTRYVSSEAGFVTDGRKGAGLRVASLDREQLASRCVKHVTGDQGTQVLSNGAAMPGVQIRIVNEEGDDVASDRIGEIWIRSPGLAAGYKEEPDLTAAAFGDGWYRSGDAGFLDDGELFITGRIKDMLIVRGANLYAEDIEAVVHAAVPSVTCCAFGVQGASSEEVVLTLESLEGKLAQHSVAEARTAVWRTMGISVLEVVEMAPGTTPRTDSGKLQRRVLKARYEAGALNGAGGSN